MLGKQGLFTTDIQYFYSNKLVETLTSGKIQYNGLTIGLTWFTLSFGVKLEAKRLASINYEFTWLDTKFWPYRRIPVAS